MVKLCQYIIILLFGKREIVLLKYIYGTKKYMATCTFLYSSFVFQKTSSCSSNLSLYFSKLWIKRCKILNSYTGRHVWIRPGKVVLLHDHRLCHMGVRHHLRHHDEQLRHPQLEPITLTISKNTSKYFKTWLKFFTHA